MVGEEMEVAVVVEEVAVEVVGAEEVATIQVNHFPEKMWD